MLATRTIPVEVPRFIETVELMVEAEHGDQLTQLGHTSWSIAIRRAAADPNQRWGFQVRVTPQRPGAEHDPHDYDYSLAAEIGENELWRVVRAQPDGDLIQEFACQLVEQCIRELRLRG